MLLKKIHKFALYTLLIVSLCHCAEGKSFDGGDNETIPDNSSNSAGIKGADDSDATPLFEGYFDFIIRKRSSGRILCQGESTITQYKIKSSVKGLAKCSAPLLKISRGSIEFDSDDAGDEDREVIEIEIDEARDLGLDSRVTYLKKDGRSTYIPRRPDFIGPIIQDPDKFADIDFVEKFKVEYKTDSKKKPLETGEGEVHVKVLEVNGSYQPDGNPETFENVLHYHQNATGFKGLSAKASSNLYEVYEVRYSTKPLIILNIHIESPLGDFEEGKISSALGQLAIGGLTVDMNLKDFIRFD